jgi:hypothetical protein
LVNGFRILLIRLVKSSLIAASVGLWGCPKEEAPAALAVDAPFQLAISIFSDPGRPVAGAQVLLRTKPVGTSDASGLVKVEVVGNEGDSVGLGILCPDGFRSPERQVVASLRQLAPGSPPPRFEARCTPLLRTTVVGIRSDNGANLPVLYLGKEVARTDVSGTAHFVLQLKPGEPVVLTLSTAEKEAEQLRPQNPSLTFVGKDQDDIVLLEQKFVVERKKVVVRPAAPKPMPL